MRKINNEPERESQLDCANTPCQDFDDNYKTEMMYQDRTQHVIQLKMS